MVLFQQVYFYTGENIRILLIVTIVVIGRFNSDFCYMQYTFRVVSTKSQSLIRKLTPTIDKIYVLWYIIGILTSTGLDVNARHICNWIFAQTKITIIYSTNTKIVKLNV